MNAYRINSHITERYFMHRSPELRAKMEREAKRPTGSQIQEDVNKFVERVQRADKERGVKNLPGVEEMRTLILDAEGMTMGPRRDTDPGFEEDGRFTRLEAEYPDYQPEDFQKLADALKERIQEMLGVNDAR